MADKSLTDDMVTTTFSVEELIISDTVRVSLDITKVNSDASFNLKKTLREVYDVDWAIIKLSRYDDSGLERISASAVARIPENQVTTVNHNLREVSKAGLKITVSGLDYSPERNRVEETNNALRKRIYTLAQDEANSLNELVVESVKWRVGSIEFNRQNEVIPKSANYITAAAFRSDENAVESTTDFSHKVSLSAAVTLVRTLAF